MTFIGEGLFGWGQHGACMQKHCRTVLFVTGLSGYVTERVRLQASSSRLLAVQPVRRKSLFTC